MLLDVISHGKIKTANKISTLFTKQKSSYKTILKLEVPSFTYNAFRLPIKINEGRNGNKTSKHDIRN